MVGSDWRFSCYGIGGFRSSLFRQLTRCSLRDWLWYQSAVGLFDRGHPCFRNFNFINPNDVVRLTVRVHGLECGGGKGGEAFIIIGETWRIIFVNLFENLDFNLHYYKT